MAASVPRQGALVATSASATGAKPSVKPAHQGSAKQNDGEEIGDVPAPDAIPQQPVLPDTSGIAAGSLAVGLAPKAKTTAGADGDGPDAERADTAVIALTPVPGTTPLVVTPMHGKAGEAGSSGIVPSLVIGAGTQASHGKGTIDTGSPDIKSMQAGAEPVAKGFAHALTSTGPDQPVAAAAGASQAAPGGPAVAVPTPGQIPPQAVSQVQPAPVESHARMAFHPDKAAREMGLEIARRVSNGSNELLIRLDPAELGRINIRMSVNEHGHLRAVVAADAPLVLDAIKGNIVELNRSLEQAGVLTDSQSFRFDRGGNSEQGSQWQQHYQQRGAATHRNDTSTQARNDDEPTYRPMATNGRINMMA
jgi:hypothetical protein